MSPTLLRLARTAVLCTLIGGSGTACAGKREYIAYCAAPGGQFVLRAAYQHSPLAIARSSPDSMVQNWAVWSMRGGNRGRESKAPATIQFTDRNRPDCSQVGIVDGMPIVNLSFLRADGTWFPVERVPNSLRLSMTTAELSEPVRKALEKANVSTGMPFALVVPRGDKLVFEQPLYRYTAAPEAVIEAVYQSVSQDGGLTWSAGVVSSQAQIFELGKTRAAQGFAAHLQSGGTVDAGTNGH